MASVTVDSELMTNYVSAVPAPAGSHHVTVLDENRMPMLFCLSNDIKPRLRVICMDENGHSDMIDINGAIGLPEDARIEAFHAEQSWSLKIFLCVAYKLGQSPSQLSVSQPFSPQSIKARSALPQIPGGTSLGTVQKIYMSPISGNISEVKYPDIFLAHRNLEQSQSWGSDITHIRVSPRLSWWEATNELETPENTSAILDIAPAVNPYGQGMYVLYVSQGITKLYGRFIRPDPNADDGSTFTFVTSVACPKGARCIATVLNDRGYSCLLIAASDGIRYLNVREATSKEEPGQVVFSSDMFKNVKELNVVQDKSAVTLWFRTARDELAYTRTDTSNVAGLAVSSLLLPAGQATAFAPVVTRATSETGNCVRQMVVTNDKSGNLTLLEQTSDLGLWRRTPFYAPSQREATELRSYTVNLKAKNAQKQPLGRGAVFLSASSTLSVIINGRYVLLTQVPTWYDCDETGSLDFIVPSDSLGSQVFRIESLKTQDGDILDFQQMFYDPAAKPMALLAEKLSSVKSGEDMAALKTSNGKPLLSPEVQKDKDTLAGAQSCLKAITQAYIQLPDSGSSALAKPETSLTRAVTNAATNTIQQTSNSTGSFLLDGWVWITEKIDDVTEWIIEATGTVWKFVCKIAGEIKEFVLDCVEKICEAASWIWEKLKVTWNTLVEFVGFLFSWDDILTTKNSISSTLTAGFGYAALKIDSLSEKVDEFFDGIENTIEEFGSSIKTERQLTEGQELQDSAKDKSREGGTSTGWASERLKNGGAGSNTESSLNGAKASSEADNFWTREVAPIITKLETEFNKLGDDLFQAFADGSLGMNTIMTASARLVKAGVIAVRAVVKGLLALVKLLVGKLSDLGNAPIEISIFSWLYRKISGHDLTIFDAISLIIAIPTTIISKAITGKAPPTFDKLDTPMLKSIIEGDESVSEQTKTDWTVFKAEVALGTTSIAGIVGFIKVLYKMVTSPLDAVVDELDEGPGSLFDIFGICVDLIGCITSIPEEADLPGGTYRNWISGITFMRGAYHTVVYFTKSKSRFEKVILGLDLLTVLATLGLSIAVGVAEHDAAKNWEEYDEDTTNNGIIAAGLNAVSGICYFTAHMLKSTNPDISAGAAAVMIGTIAGTAVVEGVSFNLQYEKDTKIRLVGPPPV